MIDFQPIQLKDKGLLNSYLSQVNYRNCDFSFANLFCWQSKYQSTFAEIDGFLVVRYICDDHLPCFMMPIGAGNNLASVLKLMINDAKKNSYRFRIHAVTQEMFSLLNVALPDVFSFLKVRNYFEYIYLREDLATLKGKKFQPKRNHINRFERDNPAFQIQPITTENIKNCVDLYRIWAKNHHTIHPEADLTAETAAVMQALENFEPLGLRGLLLTVGETPTAFTYGMPLSDDTFAVHAEKALHEVNGAYAIINQEFAKSIPEQYTYINREEDLGIDSLRQAKMSYHPHILLQRGSVCLKGDGIFTNDESICG